MHRFDPLAGPVPHLVTMTVDSDPATNQYVPSPKAVSHPVG
ncbi:hypothetical protein ACFU6M_03685 [Streptomyces bottropensis]